MLEIVTKIKEAEQEAEQMKKQAWSNAALQKQQAQEKGKELVSNSKAKAVAEAGEIILKAEQEAAALLEQSRADTKTQCDALKAKADQCMEQAAGLIVERIVGRI